MSTNDTLKIASFQATDKDGKETKHRLVAIGTDETIKSRDALCFGVRKAADLLRILNDADQLRRLREVLALEVANWQADTVPTATIEWNDKVWGLFGSRIIRSRCIRSNGTGPDTVYWRNIREGSDNPLKPEHFKPGAVLPPVPDKGTATTTGRTSAATKTMDAIESLKASFSDQLAAERKAADERAAADRNAMMEMMRQMMAANASK